MKDQLNCREILSKSVKFAQIEFRWCSGTLLREGQEIYLRPKVVAVLSYLLEHAGQLVEKAQLMDAIWGKTIVTEGAMTQCIIEIRKALGDRRDLLKTIPARGYVLDVDVEVVSDGKTRPIARPRQLMLAGLVALVFLALGCVALIQDATSSTGQTLPILVLPFIDHSQEGDFAELGYRIAEETRSLMLDRPEFRVAGKQAELGEPADLPALPTEVSQVLSGSLFAEAGWLRVRVFLFESGAQSLIWSNRYNAEVLSRVELQREIGRDVVTSVIARFTPMASQEGSGETEASLRLSGPAG